jgi:hypothetical protein
VGPLRIGWSFFAGAVGAWVIASPASYATYAGLLGLVFYSLAAGLPFIMVAFAGEKIRVRGVGVRVGGRCKAPRSLLPTWWSGARSPPALPC